MQEVFLSSAEVCKDWMPSLALCLPGLTSSPESPSHSCLYKSMGITTLETWPPVRCCPWLTPHCTYYSLSPSPDTLLYGINLLVNLDRVRYCLVDGLK